MSEFIIVPYSVFPVIYENQVQPEIGNLSAWLKYHDEVFLPLNKLFATSPNPAFEYIRNKLSINIEIVTEWERWGPCEVCGRPQGEGRRRKRGLCRLKLTSTNKVIYKYLEYFLCGKYEIVYKTVYVPFRMMRCFRVKSTILLSLAILLYISERNSKTKKPRRSHIYKCL